MLRRAFPNDPPRITFTKDYRQKVHGNLVPGQTLTVIYDAERLCHERSWENGKPAWAIQGFAQFADGGPVQDIHLYSESGWIGTKIDNEIGEGTMLTGKVDIPGDAKNVVLWFHNTGASGAEYWDSNHGGNYVFRFAQLDIRIEKAEVVRDPGSPIDWFKVKGNAAPDVSAVSVTYRISNDAAAPLADHSLSLTRGEIAPSGRVEWVADPGAPVPEKAVIEFRIHYEANGEQFSDSNSGKGYLVWRQA